VSELFERRPLIGLTVGNRTDQRGMRRLGVNRAYVDALRAEGGDVVLLPPVPAGAPPVPAALLDRLGGILLPGGADVHPARYGEEPRDGLGDVDGDLDALELGLVRTAIDHGLPLFGICRGQQVVNVALGGSLYQDLARDGLTEVRHAVEIERGRDFLAHPIRVEPGSRLRRVLAADRVEVNSFHHQAVRDVAPGLLVSAVSPADGLVEGLESADGLLLTVQCHPEELTAHGWARALFRAFVTAAARVRVRVA